VRISAQSAQRDRSVNRRRMPAPHDGDKVVAEQPQIGKPLGRCGNAASRQIKLATIQHISKLQRAARANIELDMGRLLRDRGGERCRENDDRAVVHRDCEAALGRLRFEWGSAVKRGMQILQRRANRADKPLGVGCRLHALRGSDEQIVAQGAAQPPERMADRGLRHVQPSGGTGRAALLHDGIENHQQVEIECPPVHAVFPSAASPAVPAHAPRACSGEQRALATFPCGSQSYGSPVVKEPPNMRRRLIVLTCAIVAGAAGLTTCWLAPASPAPAQAAAPPQAIPVVTEKVGVADMPLVKVGLGTAAAYNTVSVHSQVTGTIQKIGFVEGRTVQPGDLIAQLDPRPFQAALQQAQANLVRDQAHLANAQANLSRYVPLLKRGFSTSQQVGDQASAVAQLQAAIASDQAAIDNARTQLSYTTITSPISGVTGIRRVDIGNVVQPTDTTPIVTITQIQPVSVIFTLPQKDLPEVQAAMQQAPLRAIAYPQDGATSVGEGSLLLVDNQISQASGTVRLKATFLNKNGKLWPGEFLQVRLIIGVRPASVSVPLTALQQGADGQLVFVVNPGNTVRVQPVTVIESLDGRALVGDGLKAGDTVVTAGQYRLQDGSRINPVPAGSSNVQNQTPATQGMLG
jgi:multidrug efflux system membrane fusion protein